MKKVTRMKRLLLSAAAIFFSISTFAATLLSVQLLNPTGSTSGQAIVSTGASSAPAWSSITVGGIAAIAANTVLANATNSSAAPTAFTMPSCTGSTNALAYISGAGVVCNSAINAATLNGATFAAPPAAGYGSGTPEPVFATTLNATGNDALLYFTTNGQSIPSSTLTTVTTWTKTFDRVNANFAASTGIFTAPATGYYQVSGQFVFLGAVGVVGAQYSAAMIANGVSVATASFFQESTSSDPVMVPFSAVIQLNAGQTFVVQAFQNTGSARALVSTAGLNYLSINRLP